jgi:RNA polymerase sigma-70 factor (ECF subfamily)
MTQAARAAETAARASYGRLLAYLSARTRDIAAAEDALADAFRAALETWPNSGIPDKPEAWLLTAARNRLNHLDRHARTKASAAATLALIAEEAAEQAETIFPDDRLKLLFICAHPAIDPAARTPLMLQTVLGVDAARIASSFLSAPATMSQRLVRAKTKIRDAGIAFETPERASLPERLEAVLESIYAAYGLGWDNIDGADAKIAGFSEEALFLGSLLVSLLPESAEARGLRALMLYCEARAPARRSATGGFVPLSDQNPALWNRAMVIEAEQELTRAAKLITGDPAAFGRFQIEAAMQSIHIQRAVTGKTDWPVVIALYETLIRRAPSIGAWVGRAAAYGEAGRPGAGLLQLDELPPADIQSYQPFWAVRADLLAKLGNLEEARSAYARAIGLSQSPAIKNYLTGRMVGLPSP